jgi:hypothetical protein
VIVTHDTYENGVKVSTREVTVPDPTLEQANEATIRGQALTALTANRAYIASTPTAVQATAQSKALTRQVNGIIRLLLNQLDGVD